MPGMYAGGYCWLLVRLMMVWSCFGPMGPNVLTYPDSSRPTYHVTFDLVG